MTFSTALATDIGKIRLAIGDDTEATGDDLVGVLPNGHNFSDEQLQVWLDEAGGDWNRAVVRVLRNLAARYTRASNVRTGDVSEDLGDRAREYREMADTWESGMGIDYSRMFGIGNTDSDGSTSPFPFGWKMHGIEIKDQREDD